MKTNTQPKLHITLSKEHNKYRSDVADAFKGLNVSFDSGLMRFSAEGMAMQIILAIGTGVVSNAVWDLIKVGIKKLHKKFNTARITLRDSESIMYTVKPDLSVTVLVVPDRKKEFEHIKTIDDLVKHLKRKIDPNVPSSWKKVTLGDLFDFKNGLNSEKENFGHGVRFINIMEILKHDFLVAENIPGRINVDPKRNKENTVEYGNVLFNRTSETPDEVGMTSVYLDTESVVFGGFVIRAKPKSNDLNDLFKKYCFSSEQFRKEVIKQGQGVVRGNIGQSNLRVIPFLLPPKDEQARIVSVLETWDKVIENLNKKIEIKKEIKKDLMQDLLTGKKRLSGFKNNWELVNLGDVSEISRGDSITKKDITHGNIPVIAGGQKPAYHHNKSNRDGKTITVSGSGAYAGYVDFYDRPIFVSDGMSIQETKLNIDFVYYFLKMNQEYVYSLQTGGAQPHVYPKDLQKLKLQISLDKKEQMAIADILITADKEITKLEKKLSIFKEQKRYLLNNLITGTIRTPETLSIN